MSENNQSLRNDAFNYLRGICMGCADVVPGVSGGTVALILGIYERLVTAISHVDGSLLSFAKQGKWQRCVAHIELRFLAALGAGIVTGVVATSLIIYQLLEDPTARAVTFAVFSGMILASSILVARLIHPAGLSHTVRCVAVGVAGIAVAYWVSTLQPSDATRELSHAYTFVCGAIAICAMILPGISGALLLLVLGIYGHLTEVPHNLLHGEHVVESLVTTIVFGSGCLISLILFSKVLRWLLSTHHAMTMALLCGFMIGALRKLWPFQLDLTPDRKFKEKLFDAYLPEMVDGTVIAVCVAVILATAFVFTVHHFARTPDPSSPADEPGGAQVPGKRDA